MLSTAHRHEHKARAQIYSTLPQRSDGDHCDVDDGGSGGGRTDAEI